MLHVARDLFKESLYLFRGATVLPEEDGSPDMIPENEQGIIGVRMTLIRLAYTHDLEDNTSVIYRNLKTDFVKKV